MVTLPKTGPKAGPGRRAFLAALASAGAVRGAPAFLAAPLLTGRAGAADGPKRLAAIDWAMAETAQALGLPPLATAELIAFRRDAPALPPAETVDLGLRGSPNLEILSLVAPDLILSSSYYSFAEPALQRIAPVFSRALYVPKEPPFPKLVALVTDLAERLDRRAEGEAYLAATRTTFTALAMRARRFAERPCLLIEIGDSRHIRVFGNDSLFGGALVELGLSNGWSDNTRFAFAAPVPLTRLADFPEARLVILGDLPPQAQRALSEGAFWNSLPPVRAGRVHRLPELNGFGAMPSALRFADALIRALEQNA